MLSYGFSFVFQNLPPLKKILRSNISSNSELEHCKAEKSVHEDLTDGYGRDMDVPSKLLAVRRTNEVRCV